MKLENPSVHAATLEPLLDAVHANRQFRRRRVCWHAPKDVHWTPEGREVLDGTAGLWCVNAGHSRKPIVEAVQKQAATMDLRAAVQHGHPLAFEAATASRGSRRLAWNACSSRTRAPSRPTPRSRWRWHITRARGEPSRRIIIGRERGYHGVNIGGTTVGGIPGNRKGVSGDDGRRRPHPLDARPGAQCVLQGPEPAHGADFADELEATGRVPRSEQHRGRDRRADGGSAGVLIPPKGYLDKLAATCRKHGILLIFDEVITGFGRLGTAVRGALLQHHAGPADLREGDQ